MIQMPAKQSTTYEESWRTTSLKGPWKEISIDVIGPLPKSNEKNAIVVIVDQFTKMI